MNVYFRLQHHCFGMVGKQWFNNVRMTVISSFTIADSIITGLSHPFLGMGPGPMELGKLAAF